MTFDQAKAALWALIDGWPGITEEIVGAKLTINAARCGGDIDAAYARMLPEYQQLRSKGLRLRIITA